MGKKLKNRSFWDQLSTKPNPESFLWAEKQFSLLAAVILWSMWLCRVFSPLQWVKYIYRVIATTLLRITHRKDQSGEKNGSGRVNVPPILCEVYYLLWTVYFALIYWGLLAVPQWLLRASTVLFLFESVVWVLYYTIFRRFFESRYSIYHELEYLSLLILVIPTQALCFALRYGASFWKMLTGLMGATNEDTPVPVTMLGILFMAIVVSMIISAFPTEKVKKFTPRIKMLILGNGAVVKQRLIPALETMEEEFSAIHTLPGDGAPEPGDQVQGQYCKLIRDNLDHRSIVWIATPTHTHVEYLKEMLETSAELIVLEKPITADLEELAYVQTLTERGSTRERIFFLNYYLLEKALPLVWLLDPKDSYTKYLDMDPGVSGGDWQERLGKLLAVNVEICEGDDPRKWVSDPRYGGHWLETFIHNVQLASRFVGLPYAWQQESCTREQNRNELWAEAKGVQIHLLQRKGVEKCGQKRFLEARYEHGRIYMDMEQQMLRLEFLEEGRSCRVWIRQRWRQKYAIMADLVLRVKRGQIPIREADGLHNEILINRWLLERAGSLKTAQETESHA